MKTKLLTALCTIVLCYSINLSSQTVTDLNPIKDNSIYSENNNSNGLGLLFSGTTGSNNGNNNRRALIKFDLTTIPNNATVTNVSLTLNVNQTPSGVGTQTYSIHGLTKDWGEGTSTGGGTGGAAVAPDATWSNAMLSTSLWTTLGGDFTATSMASLSVSGLGNYTFLSTTNFISAVQNWVNTSSSNNGLILIGDESGTRNARQFGSKDSGVSPILSVTWTGALGVDDFAFNNFSVTPNPSSKSVKLQFPNLVTEAYVRIYDILGKVIYNSNYLQDSEINISTWNPGVYLIKVTSLDSTITKRLVKL